MTGEATGRSRCDAGRGTGGIATPVPLDRPPCRLAVVRDADAGRSAVLVTMHHALGNGLAVTATLLGPLSDRQDPRVAKNVTAASRREDGRWARVVRGGAGAAGSGEPDRGGPGAGPAWRAEHPDAQLRHGGESGTKVRAAARGHGVSTTALPLALIGDTVHRITASDAGGPDRLRG